MESSVGFGATAHAPAGSRPAPGSGPSPDHVVQFYESDDFLYEAVARFIVQGLKAHEPLLVVATA